MIAAGIGIIGTATAATAYLRSGGKQEEADNSEPVLVDAPTEEKESQRTWKESAGRTEGRDGYVFGDVTRGVVARVWGTGKETVDEAAEAAKIEADADEKHTHIQLLVREAVRLYRARGYCGTINMSSTVAYFTESVSVSVKKPEMPPWEANSASDADAAAAASVKHLAAANGKAGLVFSTLLSRLERRAKSWKAFAGVEGLDPNLTSSGQIGMRMPVINVGWGVSISLTVSASSLLAWTEHEARCTAIEEGEAAATEVGAVVAKQTVQDALALAPSAESDATEVD